MRLASRVVALALALFSTLGVLAAVATAADAVTLSGTISAPAGQSGAVAGTEVSVRMPGTAVQVAYTQADADGEYRIEGLAPGTYDVRFAPPVFSGFGPALLGNEDLTGDRRLDLQLVSADSAAWSGTVRDGSGAVVPGASLSVGPVAAYSDDAGRFSVSVPPGRHALRVSGAPIRRGVPVGTVTFEGEIDLSGVVERDLTLPTVDVRVRAFGPSGALIAGAQVTGYAGGAFAGGEGPLLAPGVRVTHASGFVSEFDSASTDSEGVAIVVLPRSAEGSFWGKVVSWSEPGLVPASLVVDGLGADRSVDVSIDRGSVWSGTVRDSSGAVVPHASLAVGDVAAYSDDAGRFSVSVPPGRHALRVSGAPIRRGVSVGTVTFESEIDLSGVVEQDLLLPTVDVKIRAVGPSGSLIAGAQVTGYAGGAFAGGEGPLLAPGVRVTHASGFVSEFDSASTDSEGVAIVVLPRNAASRVTGRITAPSITTLPVLDFEIQGLGADMTKAFSFARSSEDSTAPVVLCDTHGIGADRWLAAPPTITCTASDYGVGLADPAQSSFTVTPDVPDDGEYEGTYTAHVRVCDKADNCTELEIPVNVDAKAPTLDESVPADGASYPQGSVVELRYAGKDDGSGVARCEPESGNAPGTALDTSVPGHYEIEVACVDEVGNQRLIEIGYDITEVEVPVERNRAGYLAEIAADGPTAHWNANGGVGLGNGPTLHYANPSGATTDAGLFPDDQAARFAGAPTYAYGNGLVAPAGDYTLEAWVRPTAAGQTATIMGQGSAGWLLLRGGVPAFRAVDREFSGGAAPADRWTHVVGTWSKSGRVARLYVDGALVASGSAPTAPSGGATFYLGYGEHASWFAGGLDEPAVYGSALSPGRVAAHFDAGRPSPALAGGGGDDARRPAMASPGRALEDAAPTGLPAVADHGALPAAQPSGAAAPAPAGAASALRAMTPGPRARASLRRSRSGSQAVVRCPRTAGRAACHGRLRIRARGGRALKTLRVSVASGRSKSFRVPPGTTTVRFVQGR